MTAETTARKFGTLGEEEIDDILQKKDSDSTKKVIRNSINIFTDFLNQNPDSNSKPDLKNVSKEDLNTHLRSFFANVRTKNGEYLKTSSLTSMRYGLVRYFKAERGFDLTFDPEFQSMRDVYKAVVIDLAKRGLAKVDHKPAITQEDLIKLFSFFDISNPDGLQKKVWFCLMFYVCRRGRENVRQMNKTTFKVDTDSVGRRFVVQVNGEYDKNHREAQKPDETNGEGRMYDWPGSAECPVAAFELYVAKLNPDNPWLWQRALTNRNTKDRVWYSKGVLGKNTLSSLMSDISKEANLSRTYSNHSIRATCITVLDDSGYEARHIMRISGHRNESSIRSYSSRLNDTRKRSISDTLSSALSSSGTIQPHHDEVNREPLCKRSHSLSSAEALKPHTALPVERHPCKEVVAVAMPPHVEKCTPISCPMDNENIPDLPVSLSTPDAQMPVMNHCAVSASCTNIWEDISDEVFLSIEEAMVTTDTSLQTSPDLQTVLTPQPQQTPLQISPQRQHFQFNNCSVTINYMK